MYEPEFFEEGHRLVVQFMGHVRDGSSQCVEAEVLPDVLEGIMRSAHTIKGIAALVDFPQLVDLAKSAEYTADAMRVGKACVTQQGFECFHKSGVLIEAMLEAAAEGDQVEQSRCDEVVRELDILFNNAPVDDGPDVLDIAGMSADDIGNLDDYVAYRMRYSLKRKRILYEVSALFEIDTFDVELEKCEEALKKVGEIISNRPSSRPQEGTGIAFDLLVASKADVAAVADTVVNHQAECAVFLSPAT
jgi:HPt (histidine-containing phosphotransfer) domain-containing protein